jgi:hypothetical protein
MTPKNSSKAFVARAFRELSKQINLSGASRVRVLYTLLDTAMIQVAEMQ